MRYLIKLYLEWINKKSHEATVRKLVGQKDSWLIKYDKQIQKINKLLSKYI